MNNKPLTNKDGEVRELTSADFANAKPASELFPDIVEAQRAGQLKAKGRPKSSNPKIPVTIRLSPEVVEYFKSKGKGWQTRVDETLKEHVEAHK